MPQDAGGTVKSALEAFNNGKSDDLGKLFTSTLGSSVQATLKDTRTTFPDLKYTIDNIETHGTQVAFSYSATGTQKGALAGHASKGKSATWHGSGVATVKDGKISHLQLHEDHLSKMLQLGIGVGHLVLADPTVTGKWAGSAQGITVNLNLNQSGTAVTGTATATGLSPIPVTGSCNFPSVALHGNLNGVQIDFSGTFSNPNTIAGTLTALGSSLPVTVTRQ